MTVKEFKRALACGLGRCVMELERGENIERFRAVILDACLHNPAFEPISEVSRAPYLYELLSYYERDYFLVPMLEKFAAKCDNYWDFPHLCELLSYFAEDGDERARAALIKKYDELYVRLLTNGEKKKVDEPARKYEALCVELTSLDGYEAFKRIVTDMAKLFEKNERYRFEDFEWFFINFKDKAPTDFSAFLKVAEDDPALKTVYDGVCASEKRTYTFSTNNEPNPPPTAEEVIAAIGRAGGRALAIRFKRFATDEEKQKAAQLVLNEHDPNKKAKFLDVLFTENFPLAHEELIAYVQSQNASLRRSAWKALKECKSSAVHDFTRILLERNEKNPRLLTVFIANFKAGDEALLLKHLHALRITYAAGNGWHDIVSAILNAYDNEVPLPDEALLFVYEKSRCSFCREYAVKLMIERGLLTERLREECLHDCNYEIVETVENL